jgi:hypothetical protein
LNFSTSYHPQTDGQTERTNQIIEDMLRMYVRTKPSKWEDYLHLVEFAYNNGYQTSAKLSPFEILYGRKCMTPISWDNPADRLMVGPEMLQEMENMVRKVQQNLKEAQDRQEELCRSEKKTLGISSRRPCLFEGQGPKELIEVRELCQAGYCVCMSSDSMPMQNQDDRAPMTDATLTSHGL